MKNVTPRFPRNPNFHLKRKPLISAVWNFLGFGQKRRPLFFFWFFLLLFEYLACEKSCCITWSNESQINVMIHTWSLSLLDFYWQKIDRHLYILWEHFWEWHESNELYQMFMCTYICIHNPVFSLFMAYHRVCDNSNPKGATFGAGTVYPSEHLSSSPYFSGVHFAQIYFSVQGFVDHCKCFLLLSFFLLTIVLSVLRMTTSDLQTFPSKINIDVYVI